MLDLSLHRGSQRVEGDVQNEKLTKTVSIMWSEACHFLDHHCLLSHLWHWLSFTDASTNTNTILTIKMTGIHAQETSSAVKDGWQQDESCCSRAWGATVQFLNVNVYVYHCPPYKSVLLYCCFAILCCLQRFVFVNTTLKCVQIK